VFRADPTSISPPSDDVYLRAPAIEKNFLISPPGSPPVGWEQIVEDPPNVAPLADDLVNALRNLQLLDREREGARGPAVIFNSEEAGGITVSVEDCDGGVDGTAEEDQDWVYGETMRNRERWKPVATSRPPMDIEVS
jgi:calcipressin-2